MKKLTGCFLLFGSGTDAINIRYLTEFTAPDPFLFLIQNNQSFLVANSLEFARAKRVARNTQIISQESLRLKKKSPRNMANLAYALLCEKKIKSITVSKSFPIFIADYLRKKNVRIHVAQTSLIPEREIKTTDEIKNIKQSQRAAVRAMKQAMACVCASEINARGYLVYNRKRLTSEIVREYVEISLLKDDCFCEDIIIAGGIQGADPHERGHGPLRAGEPIVIDIFPQHRTHGYWGDLTRTVIKGKVSPEIRNAYQSVKFAQQEALKMIHSGVKTKSIHQRVCKIFKQRGFPATKQHGQPVGFIHGTGHGIGLEIHEAPRIGLAKGILKEGHVITVEPGLYYPAWGGIRIEDTVVVTKQGYEITAACGKVFNSRASTS